MGPSVPRCGFILLIPVTGFRTYSREWQISTATVLLRLCGDPRTTRRCVLGPRGKAPLLGTQTLGRLCLYQVCGGAVPSGWQWSTFCALARPRRLSVGPLA